MSPVCLKVTTHLRLMHMQMGPTLQRKHKQMMDAGVTVASLAAPTEAGWGGANAKDLPQGGVKS